MRAFLILDEDRLVIDALYTLFVPEEGAPAEDPNALPEGLPADAVEVSAEIAGIWQGSAEPLRWTGTALEPLPVRYFLDLGVGGLVADILSTAVFPTEKLGALHPALGGRSEISGETATSWRSRTGPMRWDGAALQPYELPIDLATRRAAMIEAVNALRDDALTAGFRHDFGGAAGMRTLDTRGPEDTLSWLDLEHAAADLVEAEHDDQPIEIRDAGNTEFASGAATVLSAMKAMRVRRTAIKARAWALKTAIREAADEAALLSIDISAGWPASSEEQPE